MKSWLFNIHAYFMTHNSVVQVFFNAYDLLVQTSIQQKLQGVTQTNHWIKLYTMVQSIDCYLQTHIDKPQCRSNLKKI